MLSDGKVWLCAFVYFAIVSGLYGVTFWLPTIIKELGIPDPLQVGLIGAVPWAFGIVAMYLMARSADRSATNTAGTPRCRASPAPWAW